jgi:hypothetical protein
MIGVDNLAESQMMAIQQLFLSTDDALSFLTTTIQDIETTKRKILDAHTIIASLREYAAFLDGIIKSIKSLKSSFDCSNSKTRNSKPQ